MSKICKNCINSERINESCLYCHEGDFCTEEDHSCGCFEYDFESSEK